MEDDAIVGGALHRFSTTATFTHTAPLEKADISQTYRA